MSDNPTSQALAKIDNSPRSLIKQYEQSFSQVLPSHIERPEMFVRLAQAALKKGKRGADGRTDLEVAAANNPPALLAALLDCARLGLEPGTEGYYLTPRKTGGRLEILGIVGWTGYVELMYRAGAVSSVVAECVFADDDFRYTPGIDARPEHFIDWDLEDRGPLRLVYAYAVMKDGATSKVVVMNQSAINRVKAKSQGADSQYSPWRTDPEAMWLKSAVRQLRKWVPTSAEYTRERLRAERDVAAEADGPDLPPGMDADRPVSDILDDDDILDGEVVEE